MPKPRSIKISINALGGQGGGVLAGWIVKLAENSGYIAQSTSVPGVAQRTGATVYYIELFPQDLLSAQKSVPVFALTPVPGDVDIVLALEVMEAGRAIIRGFVTGETTLIASSHRVYAIAEKIHLGDGRQNADAIIAAGQTAANRFILDDMEAAAASADAVISAVMFGALAGSGALPFARGAFEETIRHSERTVDSNLAGFEAGYANARSDGAASTPSPSTAGANKSSAATAVNGLLQRMTREFPNSAQVTLTEGLKKLIDYQDVRYADLYLDRMARIRALDEECGGLRWDWRLTRDVAKHLALWMAFEDTIRVADLKTRASRFARFRTDIRAEAGQIVQVSDYMHPRIEEICDIAPAWLGEKILSTPALRTGFGVFLKKGRRIPSTKLRGFLLLSFLAGLRFVRRGSYRFKVEQTRIDDWLMRIETTARDDYALACEVAGLQRLIKGYGETHERGLANYARLLALLDEANKTPAPSFSLTSQTLASLKSAAFADEDGATLAAEIRKLRLSVKAA
jgi:indolepyruvate ferredoxin oxidoreductase, beta subunit